MSLLTIINFVVLDGDISSRCYVANRYHDSRFVFFFCFFFNLPVVKIRIRVISPESYDIQT